MTTTPEASTEAHLEELSGDECRRLLSLSAIGRIAFVVGGLPMVLPVNYRLLEGESGLWVLLRTRPGNAIDEAPEQVAFEIDGVEYEQRQGWSVLVRGVLHHLDHNEVELMSERFDPKPWPLGDRTAWLAIKPRSVTGRRLHGAQMDWAFSPAAYR